jgi:hypothetical protein
LKQFTSMKYFLLLLFLLPNFILSQNNPDSNKIFPLTEVDQSPEFPGCEDNTESCNQQKIIEHLLEEIEPSFLQSLSAEESKLFVKIIIDKEGNVRRPMVQSKDDELKNLAIQTLKKLPSFTPAIKEGIAVNVILSLPIQLTGPSVSKTSSTAIAMACRQAENAEECTTRWLMKSFLDEVYNRNMNNGDKKLEAKVYIEIDNSGKVTGFNVQGGNKKLNKVLSNWADKLPDFIPAHENGENVKSTLSYPISYESTHY